jgi:hypothetical protein
MKRKQVVYIGAPVGSDLTMEARNTKKLIKSKSGLRIVATNDEYKSPFLLCEPQWVPDSEVSVKLELLFCYVVKLVVQGVFQPNIHNVLDVYLSEHKLHDMQGEI